MPLQSDLESRLGGSLKELQEILAIQVHRAILRQVPEPLWRARREGIPYQQLPEAERSLQRQLALEALQDILDRGFQIEPPTGDAGALDLTRIRGQAESLLSAGEPLQAYDVLRPGLLAAPRDPDLRRLQGAALLQGASPWEAIRILEALQAEGHHDGATLAFLAQAHRELGASLGPGPRREAHFRKALALYEAVLEEGTTPWAGLHAATMAHRLGERDCALHYARQVTVLCREAYETLIETGQDAFWVLVVMALASLIEGGWSAARPHVQEAAEHGATRARHLAELRVEARRLMEERGEDPTELEALLPVPRVVVFAGHMVDHPDRGEDRFPAWAEPRVAVALAQRLEDLDPWSGWSSAAAGAPLLFHELMQARGAETHVVLPYDRETFLQDSVAIREDGHWPERFETVVAQAQGVIHASPFRVDAGSTAYRYTHDLILGLAHLRARQLHAELVPLVLWDRHPSQAEGSVAAAVEAWTALGHRPEVLDLRAILGQPPLASPVPRPPRTQPCLPGGLTSVLRVMLFGDVVHFSALSDAQVPAFVTHFLGMLHRLEAVLPQPPLARNTWGDGLFYVFEGLGDAASFATALVDEVRRTPWDTLGLPADLDLRVALHAGPVFEGQDPVTGRPTCFGSHVNRAARIEPITPPGLVYVSQAFAALAAARDIPGLLCDYVGRIPLAKGFGTFPMYVMRVMD